LAAKNVAEKAMAAAAMQNTRMKRYPSIPEK
jgi:hypothetical protein